ncbi:p9 [Bean yellow disorder virus]|uniref:p9 n=1 Tax=Bean yellow disorder virus TaxID=267970 RepID=B2BZW9_9CLOS|nr:p9 [Bean yellow disorder virus]ABY66968.1 p9 [Bean yellow disorder virus]
MDLDTLLDKYGNETVEKYLSKYMKARMSQGGSIALILNVINEHLVKFLDKDTKTGIDDDELKNFFECVYCFSQLPNFFN